MTDTVSEVVDNRVSVYGDPVLTFERIAQVWSAILDTKVHAWQVPLLQLGLKLIRVAEAPDYSDNSDDIEGYLEIFRKIVGPDMVQARSVVEYLEKKGKAHEETATDQSVPVHDRFDRARPFEHRKHTIECWYQNSSLDCICGADGELISNPISSAT